jgi:hypothetical protein
MKRIFRKLGNRIGSICRKVNFYFWKRKMNRRLKRMDKINFRMDQIANRINTKSNAFLDLGTLQIKADKN